MTRLAVTDTHALGDERRLLAVLHAESPCAIPQPVDRLIAATAASLGIR